MSQEGNIKVGISIGDPNGIGPEIILKLFRKKGLLDFFTPVVFSSIKLLSYYKNMLSLDVELHNIASLEKIVPQKVNIVNIPHENLVISPGKVHKQAGNHARISLEVATQALKKGYVDVLVTAPFNKDIVHSKDFPFVGHTDYLQATLSGEALMLMIQEKLKVALVTHHISLKKVSKEISVSKLIEKVKILQYSLERDFAVVRPKIALLGLNPHAGDNGLIGDEEQQEIAPAVEKLFSQGTLAFGPYPADGFFGSGQYQVFDAVLAMYHDQGLIPFKVLAFGQGVNFTAGLPWVRTSPDHGVAYDIAGKGIAKENSFEEAIFTAIKIFKNRKLYDEIKLQASLPLERASLKDKKGENRK